MSVQTKINRTYGKERTLGDIIYNPQTKSVFCSIDLGFFGKKNITLIKRADDGAYDLAITYSKNGEEQIAIIGRTFPTKKRDGSLADGLTQGTLGLLKRYDAGLNKEITDSSDALFITTHRLKEQKAFGDKGFIKVGFITGKFAIEIVEEAPKGESQQQSHSDTPEYDDDGDEIPF
jgi:hypothetical protein